jgi:hypothetical protein
MTADTLHTFARCRSLALAAMIEAGGKPCWVAAGPSPKARPALPALPGVQGENRPVGLPLTPAERLKYPGIDDSLAAAMNRAFAHFI